MLGVDSDTLDIEKAINIGTNVLVAPIIKASPTVYNYYRCSNDFLTDINLNCYAGDPLQLTVEDGATISKISKTMDILTVLSTKNSKTSSSSIYIDSGYGDFTKSDIADDINDKNLSLMRDTSGLFYVFAFNTKSDTLFSLTYDPVQRIASSMDPVTSSSLGLTSDLCIQNISSNPDTSLMELVIYSKCQTDTQGLLVVITVSSGGLSLKNTMIIKDNSVDKVCHAQGQKYALWSSVNNSKLTLVE